MTENRIKRRIKQGRLAVGTYVLLRDPAIIEIIGLAGFDAAFIDMEHTCFEMAMVEDCIRACDLAGIASIVRVPENNSSHILRVLEAGAQCVQAPHVQSVEDAVRAVKAVRYAPLGERSVAPSTRAARYGAIGIEEHMAASNAGVLLAVMVEDMKAVEHLADIASVPGVDLIAVGPNDLSAAMGAFGPADPALRNAIEGIAETIRRVGKAKMTFPLDSPAYPLNAAQLQQMGVVYANCGPTVVDILFGALKRRVADIEAQIGP